MPHQRKPPAVSRNAKSLEVLSEGYCFHTQFPRGLQRAGGAFVSGEEGEEHHPGRLDRLGPGEVDTPEALVFQILTGLQARSRGREGKEAGKLQQGWHAVDPEGGDEEGDGLRHQVGKELL